MRSLKKSGSSSSSKARALAVAIEPLDSRLLLSTTSLPLSVGGTNKADEGSFAGGTLLQITASGHGDLVDSRYQVKPDGTMYAPGTGAYAFANKGAVYTKVAGGDGINHFVGGGANYDVSGSGFPFAGKLTTDTTDPADIRVGAIVGTFSANPTRANWFVIGTSGKITVPSGGAHLYLAGNDTFSGDNHGTFSVTISTVAPASIAGRVFNDANNNGKRDIGENGLGLWKVYLDLNNNGKLDSTDKVATTDILGNYKFASLFAGKYVVRIVPVTGINTTTPSGGSYTYTLTAGQNVTNATFGERSVT